MWTWGVWGAPVILDFDAGRALSRVVRSRPTLLDGTCFRPPPPQLAQVLSYPLSQKSTNKQQTNKFGHDLNIIVTNCLGMCCIYMSVVGHCFICRRVKL